LLDLKDSAYQLTQNSIQSVAKKFPACSQPLLAASSRPRAVVPQFSRYWGHEDLTWAEQNYRTKQGIVPFLDIPDCGNADPLAAV